MTYRRILSSALAAVLLGALFSSPVWAKDEPLPQTLITNVQIFDGVNDKLTPADAYFGRQHEVLTQRAKIKRVTMKKRKREYLAARAA